MHPAEGHVLELEIILQSDIEYKSHFIAKAARMESLGGIAPVGDATMSANGNYADRENEPGSSAQLQNKLDTIIASQEQMIHHLDEILGKIAMISIMDEIRSSKNDLTKIYVDSFRKGQRDQLSFREYTRLLLDIYGPFPIIIPQANGVPFICEFDLTVSGDGSVHFSKITMNPDYKDPEGLIYQSILGAFSQSTLKTARPSEAGLSAPVHLHYWQLNMSCTNLGFRLENETEYIRPVYRRMNDR